MKAWLVTWEWVGDHAAVDKKVVDILSARRSAEWVRDYVERLYMLNTASLRERSRYAAYNKPASPPYPAEFVRLGRGIPYSGRIHCGHNPHLYARVVNNLKFGENDSVTWDELPLPTLPDEFN